jgi:hypothetical protein
MLFLQETFSLKILLDKVLSLEVIYLCQSGMMRERMQAMFTLETTEISNAIDRAKALHPKVSMIRFGEYAVTGSKGNSYTVRCYRERGQRVVDCACPTRDGVACKHGMAAVSLHIAVAARAQRH